MITCLGCEGRKAGPAFVDYADGSGELKIVACHTCKGIGEITEEHAERMKVGAQLRRDRLNRRLTLNDEAKRLGITPTALSAVEFGRLTLDEVLKQAEVHDE